MWCFIVMRWLLGVKTEGGRVRPIVMHLSRLMTCAQPDSAGGDHPAAALAQHRPEGERDSSAGQFAHCTLVSQGLPNCVDNR